MYHPRFLKRPRRGTIAVLAAFLMVVMVALLAFAIDIGVVINSRNDMQRAADAGALAAALELASNPANTTTVGRQYVRLNSVVTSQLSDAEIAVEIGKWDKATKSFTVSSTNADAVRISLQQTDQPLFFGRVLGSNQYSTNASAVATFKPRDIMLVLDYSGSMFDEDKINGLKSATTLFCDTVQQTGQGKDRIGFVRYSTDATLECALTYNIANVKSSAIAGDPDGFTNIGGGLAASINELMANGRSNAKKVILLLTDGMANRPQGTDPNQYVYDQAAIAQAENIMIFAVSFGSDADQSLMDQTATIANGVHFHVGSSSPEEMNELNTVFRNIAANKNLQLVN